VVRPAIPIRGEKRRLSLSSPIHHSLFIVHYSYIVTTLFYWRTGAFLHQLQLQLPPPLPLLATAATTFKRRSPSQIIQEPRSFPPPPIRLPQTKTSHPCDSKDPTDRWLSAHPHPTAEF
jgi:hypothetical protein